MVEEPKVWAKAVEIPCSFSSHQDNNKGLINVIIIRGEI
jgi:hypothetical protein